MSAERELLVPGHDRRSGGNRPLLECYRRQWRPGKPVRLVQGQMGPVLADNPAPAHGYLFRPCSCRHPARVRSHAGDAENLHRQDRSRAEGRFGLKSETASRSMPAHGGIMTDPTTEHSFPPQLARLPAKDWLELTGHPG